MIYFLQKIFVLSAARCNRKTLCHVMYILWRRVEVCVAVRVAEYVAVCVAVCVVMCVAVCVAVCNAVSVAVGVFVLGNAATLHLHTMAIVFSFRPLNGDGKRCNTHCNTHCNALCNAHCNAHSNAHCNSPQMVFLLTIK